MSDSIAILVIALIFMSVGGIILFLGILSYFYGNPNQVEVVVGAVLLLIGGAIVKMGGDSS